MAATAVESWDDDDDLHGDFQPTAGYSSSTAAPSISSRLSVHTESVVGDEDWNVFLQPNHEESSTTQAIQSARAAGIPLPSDVPRSALLGGAIRRLGRKKSRQRLNEHWDDDLEMPDEPLKLKPRRAAMPSVSFGDELDDFDELEGSLGIRFAGTTREARHRSSSAASIVSASLCSAIAESEIDELGGLELPEGPVDFEAILKKRRAVDAELSDISQPSPTVNQGQNPPSSTNHHKKSKLVSDDNEDFLDDFDLGVGGVFDVRKRANKNIQVKSSAKQSSSHRHATNLSFHDKPVEKFTFNRSHIPRPVSGSKRTSRLEPVFESGVPPAARERRQPTTTSAQLLRSKRSMPALRNHSSTGSLGKASYNFGPSGTSYQPTQRAMPYHLRRDSDPRRQGAQSPPPTQPPRPHSRLSSQISPDTPSRAPKQRQDVAPVSLAREAAAKRTLTKPARKRNFGDGSELELFDDLPTSQSKESKFVKHPVSRGPPKRELRQTQSRGDIRDVKRACAAIPDRMVTPAPPKTPVSPTKAHIEPSASSYTPSYLRDTAASRIARETRLGHAYPRPKSEGPLQPLSTNWKAQLAARSPYSSPNASRHRGKRPALIAAVGSHIAKSEKGMTYNPQTLCWEGNENSLAHFDAPLETPTPSSSSNAMGGSYMDSVTQQHQELRNLHQDSPPQPQASSPTRPALIAQIPTGTGLPNIQVQNGMVYDPQQMKWLKVKGGRDVSGQLSPSITDVGEFDDEEDAFAGIEDLKEEGPLVPTLNSGAVPFTTAQSGLAPGAAGTTTGGSVLMASPISIATAGVGEVHEEFDLGPRFIKLQREEEIAWRRRCEAWFTPVAPSLPLGSSESFSLRARDDDGLWRRDIRAIVPQDGF